MWSNDIKCKCMFLFPLKNLACKGLINRGPTAETATRAIGLTTQMRWNGAKDYTKIKIEWMSHTKFLSVFKMTTTAALRPEKKGQYFCRPQFQMHFLKETCFISIDMPTQFVCGSPIGHYLKQWLSSSLMYLCMSKYWMSENHIIVQQW